MIKIETLYPSYQECLLDLDIFGRMMSMQNLDDKEEYKNLLFEEYSRSHPLPSLESKDYELGDIVSAYFHVSYLEELELSQNESVLDFEDDDEEDEDEGAEFSSEIVLKEDIESLPIGVFNKPVSISERDSIIAEILKQSEEIETFTASTEKTEEVFGTVEADSEGYVEEEAYEPETVEEDEEDYNYDDDVGEEDEEQEEGAVESGDLEEPEFEEVPISVPPPVIPRVIEKPPEPKREAISVPSDVLQYLRENPHSEISEVLKYYPRKELEKYIRIGKVIKKGSKVYL